MPVKRRAAKAKLAYSPVITALLAGEALEHTASVHEELVAITYFGWSDQNVPRDAIALAGAVLARWREDSSCQ